MRRVLLAKSPEEKRLGLSVIPKLADDEYALFEYDSDSFGMYWNKNVKYPIDIGFYDQYKTLIFKTSMEADQRTLVFSPEPYRYVIETNKGKLNKELAF